MIKRDVLNHNGEKIGEKMFPDGTSEQEIQAELAKYSAPPPVEPIPDITARQIRQAMILNGISVAQVEAAIDSLPEPIRSLASAEWEYSNVYVRSRPLVSQVGQILGLSSQQLDDLWRFAANLP